MKTDYEILEIECDKNGLPIGEIDDEYIGEKYEDKLVEFFIQKNQSQYLESEEKKEKKRIEEKNGEIEDEEKRRELRNVKYKEDVMMEREKIMNADQNYIAQITQGKNIQQRIVLLEQIILSHEWKNENVEEFFRYYKKAYENINTEEKRERYNKNIRSQIELTEEIESYRIRVDIEEQDDDYTYGELAKKNDLDEREILDANSKLIIEKISEMEYYRWKENHKFSPVRSQGTLESGKIFKYEISRKLTDGNWLRNSFYANGKIAEKLMEMPRTPKEEKERENYIKAIITSCEILLDSGKEYVGDIEKVEDKYQCIQNKNIDKMVQNYIIKQKQTDQRKKEEKVK